MSCAEKTFDQKIQSKLCACIPPLQKAINQGLRQKRDLTLEKNDSKDLKNNIASVYKCWYEKEPIEFNPMEFLSYLSSEANSLNLENACGLTKNELSEFMLFIEFSKQSEFDTKYRTMSNIEIIDWYVKYVRENPQLKVLKIE